MAFCRVLEGVKWHGIVLNEFLRFIHNCKTMDRNMLEEIDFFHYVFCF